MKPYGYKRLLTEQEKLQCELDHDAWLFNKTYLEEQAV